VLPSLTMITSCGGRVWANTESSAGPTQASTLYAGTITEMRGLSGLTDAACHTQKKGDWTESSDEGLRSVASIVTAARPAFAAHRPARRTGRWHARAPRPCGPIARRGAGGASRKAAPLRLEEPACRRPASTHDRTSRPWRAGALLQTSRAGIVRPTHCGCRG